MPPPCLRRHGASRTSAVRSDSILWQQCVFFTSTNPPQGQVPQRMDFTATNPFLSSSYDHATHRCSSPKMRDASRTLFIVPVYNRFINCSFSNQLSLHSPVVIGKGMDNPQGCRVGVSRVGVRIAPCAPLGNPHPDGGL